MLTMLRRQCLSSLTFIQIMSMGWVTMMNILCLVGVVVVSNALATRETCDILERTEMPEVKKHSEDGKVYSWSILKH